MSKRVERRGGTIVRRGRQRGSAYLVALLALVVLTIVGLALALVTQTELELGSNERTLNRVFYAADSGISTSIARALVTKDTTGRTIVFPEPPEDNRIVTFEERVETSPFYPILDSPCNLCEINDAGSYASRAYRKTTYAVTSRATRQGGAADTLVAEKTLSAMVDVQPNESTVETYVPITQPAELEKIRF